MMLQAQRLLRDADNRTRRPSAGIITAAKRMDRMLRDLRRLPRARRKQETLELDREKVPLRGFVAELLETSDGVLDVAAVENAIPGEDYQECWSTPTGSMRSSRTSSGTLSSARASG